MQKIMEFMYVLFFPNDTELKNRIYSHKYKILFFEIIIDLKLVLLIIVNINTCIIRKRSLIEPVYVRYVKKVRNRSGICKDVFYCILDIIR